MNDTFDAIVIGAGAAGLMASGTAAEAGRRVAIVEWMERPGRKLRITGKGRCNVTNDCDSETLLQNIRSNPRFLYSAFAQFTTADTKAFFEGRGVPLKTERGNRVFPVSDRATDIVDCLTAFADGATYIKGKAAALLIEEGQLRGIKLEDGRKIFAPKVLIATGGLSYPQTGSTGDGYQLAKQAGHTIVPPRPSLIPLIIKEGYCKEMQGLSLKNVTLTVREKGRGKVLFSELGEMLFTHYGVTGPLVLSASSHMEVDGAYDLTIDCKPGLTPQKLETRLLRDFEKYSNKDFGNALGELLPHKMIPVAIRLSGIDPATKVNQITKEMRKSLCQVIKALPLTFAGFRPIAEAIITMGGVKVGEVSPKTMESKRLPGLYFAGEVLDVDGYTGGFNLQIAFATGRLAGFAL